MRQRRRRGLTPGALRAELACAAEAMRIARRGRWYAGVVALLYARSLVSWRRMRPLRLGFCYLQRIDDMLDGDLHVTDPAAIACAQLQRWGRGEGAAVGAAPTDTGPLSTDRRGGAQACDARSDRLGDACRAVLVQQGTGDEAARAVRRVVAAMLRDHARRVNRALLDERALRLQLRATFEPSLDLVLLSLRSRLRVAHVPAVADALAAASVVRDLDEDLAAGIINLPAALVADPARPAVDDTVAAWLQAFAASGRAACERTRRELAAAPARDRDGARVITMLVRGCERRLAAQNMK